MKQLILLLMLLCSTTIFAQDVIVKKDGSTIVCRVVEVNSSEIVYKKWTDLNGSNYVMDRSLASAINYQNGEKVNLSDVKNLYKPENQSDGIQQYTDKALLALDAETHKYSAKKVKTLKAIGWTGGCILAGAGVVLVGLCLTKDGYSLGGSTGETVAAVACIAGGVAWISGFLSSANKLEKKVFSIHSYSLYRNEIKLNNGAILTPSIDILRDQAHNNQTLGIGLNYNF